MIASPPPLLNGRYRVDGRLGSGGMGVVHHGRDLLHEQYGDPVATVALKLLRDDLAQCPDGNALLYSEFALARQLCHPNIVRVYSFEADPIHKLSYFTMELITGVPLDRLLCERPSGMEAHEFDAIVPALLDALIHAHGRGVVHGDIKPSNLMFGENGVRLIDFGLGQAMGDLLPGLPRLCRDRFNAWSPTYAAAELFEGAPLSPACDLYAVACVIYELASGKHPYGRLPAHKAHEQRLNVRLERPGRIPARGWPALRQALAPQAQDRRITAAELSQAMGQRCAFARCTGWLRRWRRPNDP